jgi:hypothetical protein
VTHIDVYVEATPKRVFACTIEWPGWARSGKSEEAALDALVDYGDRYRSALKRAAKGFVTPSSTDDLRVVERIAGNASTDFGVPSAIRPDDARPPNLAETKRLASLLKAAWSAFDRSKADARSSKEPLRTGPRGGGRQVDAMARHVMEAEAAYLAKLGAPYRKVGPDTDTASELASIRDEMLGLLAALARGEPPPRTPRSGSLWPPRYAVRRSAWHALDHAWEIQDRLETD